MAHACYSYSLCWHQYCLGDLVLVQDEGERVALAACGTSHSVLLMDSGAVYTAGCNSNGQCGQDLQLTEVWKHVN